MDLREHVTDLSSEKKQGISNPVQNSRSKSTTLANLSQNQVTVSAQLNSTASAVHQSLAVLFNWCVQNLETISDIIE